MTEDEMKAHAEHLLGVALLHSQCLGGRVDAATEKYGKVILDLNVEMPLAMKVDGVSETGVRTTETVEAFLGPNYPWSPPNVYLRDDFPRNLPHLLPSKPSLPPHPCLVDGSIQEFFLQFGLLEAGIFQLVEQLAAWLQKAAVGGLNDPSQGWEPTMRQGVRDVVVLDGDAARAVVRDEGGFIVWPSEFFRKGKVDDGLADGTWTWITAEPKPVLLASGKRSSTFESQELDDSSIGRTITALIFPDRSDEGEAFVTDAYHPETISNWRELRQRASDLGCLRSLDKLSALLEAHWNGLYLDAPLPIAIVLCARRPMPLIGTESPIELLPYVVELRASRSWTRLLRNGEDEPVVPARQLDAITPPLLRRVSGCEPMPALAILGCGSVGSKVSVHLARSGATITALSDSGHLNPHNFARHDLFPSKVHLGKAAALAEELKGFGAKPKIYAEDILNGLRTPADRAVIVPLEAAWAVNCTASIAVREGLAAQAFGNLSARGAEIALFGRGYGGFLVIEGNKRNPTAVDLMTELYATIPDARFRNLLFDPVQGLAEVQIGQGCGSLTMPMTDARLSSMAAVLTEQLQRRLDSVTDDGQLITAVASEDGMSTALSAVSVGPFHVVEILGREGWTLRISPRLAERIREEAARYQRVETGGVLIGSVSARLKTIIAVELIEAPPDSRRSSSEFVLGTEGLREAITRRSSETGNALVDIGTWHSHLADQGPSQTDWSTARELAAERPPPSVLLIVTPKRFVALVAPEELPAS